jgi:hypothetical protein
VFSWTTGAPLEFESTRRTIGNRANDNTADLVGSLPDDLGQVLVGNGFVEYFKGLSTTRAPQPSFGGNTFVTGRFTNQVVVDQAGNIVLQNPIPGTTGNTALNLGRLEGPSRMNFDVALSKRVRLTERTNFSLRVDAINILNTPQWGNPETDINSAEFGRITTATGSRTVTVNARIDF